MENWFSPELMALIREAEQPYAYIALLMIAAAFPIAWAIPRLLRGPQPRHGSIVFGGRIFDGVLFPALWLGLVWLARAFCVHRHLPLAVFKVAVPILLSLLVIRLTVRVMRVAFPKSELVRAVEKTVSWLAWGGVVLWITGVLPSFVDALDDVHWKMGSGTMSLATILEGIIVAGVVLMVTLWISSAIESKMLKGATGQRLSWRKAASNLVRAALVFIGLLLALSAVGIDLTALSVLGGALGVGLGLGLQKLAANYVSGFVMLAEGALRIGDTVKVDGFEGLISDITTRYTVLRALNGREAIVPNEMMVTQRVESSTLADSRMALSTVVQVGYDTDIDALVPQILDILPGIARVIAEPKPGVQLSAFASDGLELTVSFWIADPENGTGSVKSDVNMALLRLFNANSIEIPFPQRVLRVVPAQGGSADQGVVPGSQSSPVAVTSSPPAASAAELQDVPASGGQPPGLFEPGGPGGA
ncbi:mechanosensitive ion channel family protein [Scleromatobacter humisilvae]|uniref:Mechanosensitive ion channel n=1 Tax=Scleromatobacter humisilvae TaxID=2897159 RepID=A0A9X1YM70_9BURK|nr:mechanosensitive ion channel domain-containing protein [Scleromatobacter humisilvae]MCK9689139.1 mechanosensitive ion channel [Scleromatobacter humisilvae]